MEVFKVGFPGTWMTESESVVYRVVPKCACSTIGQIMYYSDHGVFFDGDIHDATGGMHKWAIEASQPLQDVLQMIAEGRFSPDQPDRYHGLVHRVWHHDYFLVASDFDAFHAAQGEVDRAYADPARWVRMAAFNTARSGFFSSDRTIRSYMKENWSIPSAL